MSLTEPGDFLKRWSRLKQAARTPAAPPAAPPAAHPPEAAAEEPALPPLDSLTKDSDYTPFLRPGVPEALRKEALQRLYRSDPVLANLDGLVDYAEDFGAPFRAAGVVATVYRVLEGMPGREREAPRPAESQETAGEASDATPDTAAEPPEKGAPPEPAEAGRAPATAPSRRRADEVELD
ncbi:MAG: DUF3306 domain-containing protein [Stellaceae bacterium]